VSEREKSFGEMAAYETGTPSDEYLLQFFHLSQSYPKNIGMISDGGKFLVMLHQ
jgi:hypothetical protein